MLGFIWAPIAGALSDRIGRRQMYIIGCIFVTIFTFIYFGMLDTKIGWVMFLAVALSFIPVMTMYGPEAALIAEAFTPRLRYSGASLGYHLSSVIAGGPAPIIATFLLASTGSGYSVAVYVMITAIVSVIATSLLPDYTNRDISEEASYGAGVPASAEPLRVRI
jgi:MFS family permease